MFHLAMHGRVSVVLLFCLFTFLPLSAATALPKEQAAHFGRLLICDGDNKVYPLSSYIRSRQTESSDTLTPEQLFTVYVFQFGGWRTLRLFPHQEGDVVRWYAPADELPETMDAEHQKYVREVFLRLNEEVQQKHWQQVDAYIDRMEQYQSTFGSRRTARHTSLPVPLIATILFAVFMGCALLRKR